MTMGVKRVFAALMLLLPLVANAQHGVEPSWHSLNQRGYPEWFSDAKLGIFVHWGLYSVPAYASTEGYSEWFYRGLMTGDPDRRRIMSLYADTTLPVFEQYASLADHWHAELWNPDEWARMFRESGAKYVMLVTKHHDGYCLWDSPQQPAWNSTVSGPHRNIVEELTAAVRKEGMRMCFYYSLPEWTNPRHIWMQDPDDSIADYVENYMIPQFKELVSRYRPDAVFSDGDWQNTAEQFHSEELISWYYNTVGPDAIVNDRWGYGTLHGFKTPEYSEGIITNGVPWAECRGIGRSFGYNRNEDVDNFLTDRELIQHFCELVAAGGGLTLNVGPMADGTIPFIQQERLKSLGKWLKVNGEAIFGSRPFCDYDCCGNCVTNHTRYCRTVSDMSDAETIEYNWVRNAPLKNMPVDNFDIHWTGVVYVPEEGDYTFRIIADDEAWVVRTTAAAIIDAYQSADLSVSTGRQVEPTLKPDTIMYYNKAWEDNSLGTRTLHLKKDEWFNLDVYYHEKDLEATVYLQWSRDGGKTYTAVPSQWKGTATWHNTALCFTQKGNSLYIIDFQRPESKLTVLDMPQLSKYAKIRLLGTSQDLKWKQKRDGTLVIDLSGISPVEMDALEHAWVFRIEPFEQTSR